MSPSHPPVHRRRAGAFLLAVAVGAGTVAAGVDTAGVGAAGAQPAVRSAVSPPATVPAGAVRPFSVTLVTGDRVHVGPGPAGRPRLRIQPPPGRSVSYTSRHTATGLEVIPSDATALVAADRVDRRLFDVLLLHRLGYDDATTHEVPVLLAGGRRAAATGTAARTPGPRAGARSIRTSTRLGIRSLRVGKATAARFWAQTKAAAGGATAAGKVWLVGRRQPLLDHSVRQVGAPAAWQAGYTGRGVTVAVLDTGYDATHPDLKGVVTVARDFTGSPAGVKDTDGHGTHVAATVAGRGTASRGRYVGVAKGASVAVGKVCADGGCPDDAVLAGMEWAATTAKARVVNMSLGGMVGDGRDPLVDAVEALTAATGTLFVVAAGNSGPSAETVGSPAAAPSALAVGSVGRDDVLSGFSSRGPVVSRDRSGDYTLKPEITAPGERIVAARAAGTNAEYATGPGGRYAALSGTSMATPHVAGGAAILAQRHRTWKAAQLKAALTASAAPSARGTAYEQGAGRLDLARAVAARVTVDAGVLDLGYARWPNADATPVTRTLTWANAGSKPVTLALSLRLDGPDGRPAAPDAISVDRTSLTVAAGRTASATLTFRPGRAPTGLLSGRLTARTADGAAVVSTTLGAYREPESHDITVTAYDRAGRRTSALVSLDHRGTGIGTFADTDRSATVTRLAAGDYSVTAIVGETVGNGSTVIARDLHLDRTTELVLDARGGKPVLVTVPRKGAVQETTSVVLTTHLPGGGAGGTGITAMDGLPVYAVPGPAVPGLSVSLTADLALAGAGRRADTPATPWTYHVGRALGDRLPDDPTYRYGAGDFAEIRATYRRLGSRDWSYTEMFGWVPGAGSSVARAYPLKNLTRRSAYVAGSAGVTWAPAALTLFDRDGTDSQLGLAAEPRAFAPGRRYTDLWYDSVFGAAFEPQPEYGMQRAGNRMHGAVPMVADASGHLGYATGEGGTRLLRDGRQVYRTSRAGVLDVAVPAAEAGYRLETGYRHSLAGTRLSAQQRIVWTFRSGDVTTPRALPLSLVRYKPTLDDRNRAPKGRRFTIPVRVVRAPGAAATDVRSLRVDVSYDSGRTWRKATVRAAAGGWTATVAHPAKAGSVSLRAVAVNADGTRVEQTVLTAYLTR